MSHVSTSEAITRTLDHYQPDYATPSRPAGLEWQIMCHAADGRAEEREWVDEHGRKQKRTVYTDGLNEWPDATRIDTPAKGQRPQRWSVAECADRIGSTGRMRDGYSLWVGIDLDHTTGHSGTGVSDDKLARAQQAAESLPFVTIRKSSGGLGLHFFVELEGPFLTASDPSNTNLARAEHTGLGYAILAKMTADTGFDFASVIDVCGGNMWLTSRKATPENGGHSLVKAATRKLRIDEIPTNWRDYVQVPKSSEPTEPKSDSEPGPITNAILNGLRERKALDSFDGVWGSTHTADLQAVAEREGFEFKTIATGEGRPSAKPNCTFKIDDNGDGIVVFRYGNVVEPTWNISKEGKYYARIGVANNKPATAISEPTPQFKLISSDELFSSTYYLRYHVENTLAAGQPCIIAGQQKTLKTTIAIDFAINLAAGGRVFGHLQAEPCDTLLLSGESGLSTLQNAAKRIAKTYGLSPTDLKRLHWCETLPQLANRRHLDELAKVMPRNGVLFIDPCYLCMPADDPGNLMKQGSVLGPVNQICQEKGTTLVLLHHMKKTMANPNDVPELTDIAWAGFAEWARQWLLISRREKYEPGSGRHKLHLAVGGSAGHSALWALDIDEGQMPDRKWDVTISTASEMRAREADENARNERAILLGVLRQYPDGETVSNIRAKAGWGDAKAKRLLVELRDDGSVVEASVKRGGKTATIYKLAS